MIKDILIPVGTLLFGGIAVQLFNVLKYKKENDKWEKEFAETILSRKLNNLCDAFRDKENDKLSRIDAYLEYKKLGGDNFTNTLKYLQSLPDDPIY